MKYVVYVVALTILGAAIKVDGQAMNMKCNGQEVKITEEHLKFMGECMKVVGVSQVTELSVMTAGCFSKCMMEKENLIDAGGKPHKENILKAMDVLPAAVVDSWKKTVEGCLDSESGKIVTPDDKSCSSFMPLTMCVATAVMQVCTIDM